MYIFQSVVETEQWNGGPYQKHPLEENENPVSMSNQEQGLEKSIKIWKLVESQTTSVGVQARAKTCGGKPVETVVIRTGKRVYRPPLPATYKEIEILEDLKNGMEWLFRDYMRYLKQEKDPLPPGDDVMEFDMQKNTRELDKNLKPRIFPSDLQDMVNAVLTEYWDMLCEDVFHQNIQGFLFHINTVNHRPIFCKPPRYVPQ